MDYLFFDTECANSFDGEGKLCEFGYVLTDERFNVKEEKIFLINPEAPWDWFVLKRMLHYDKTVYENALTFPYHYRQVRNVLTRENTLIIGHTTDSDADYLNATIKRYGFPFINYDFYDVAFVYTDLTKEKRLGVKDLAEKFGVTDFEHLHRSVDDAKTTMLITKKLCEEHNTNLITLLNMSENAKGRCENGVVTTPKREEARFRRNQHSVSDKNTLTGKRKIAFLRFLDGVQPSGEIITSPLNSKSLTISLNYQYGHYKEMLTIVQLLKDRDCTYKLKATECDYFVTFDLINEDGTKRTCSKSKYVEQAINEGKNINIISFKTLLDLLDTTPEHLENAPLPDKKFFKRRNEEEEMPKEYKSDAPSGFSLKELLVKIAS